MKRTITKLIGFSLCLILLFSIVAVPLQARTCFGAMSACMLWAALSGEAWAVGFCGIGYMVCEAYY
jgi:hypothetical protein